MAIHFLVNFMNTRVSQRSHKNNPSIFPSEVEHLKIPRTIRPTFWVAMEKLGNKSQHEKSRKNPYSFPESLAPNHAISGPGHRARGEAWHLRSLWRGCRGSSGGLWVGVPWWGCWWDGGGNRECHGIKKWLFYMGVSWVFEDVFLYMLHKKIRLEGLKVGGETRNDGWDMVFVYGGENKWGSILAHRR